MKSVTLYFWHNGDSSVGINGDQASVSLNVDGFDALDEHEHIENAKALLRDAFGKLWDGRVHAATEKEVAAMNPPSHD